MSMAKTSKEVSPTSPTEATATNNNADLNLQEPERHTPTAAELAVAKEEQELHNQMEAAKHRPLPTLNDPSLNAPGSYESMMEAWICEAKGGAHLVLAALIPLYVSHWFVHRASSEEWAFMGQLWLLFVVYPVIAIGVAIVLMHTTHKRHIDTYKRNVKADLQRTIFRERLVTDNPLDRESVEWLNHILQRFWLIYEPVLSETIISSVNPMLEFYCPSFIDAIALSEFTLGTVPPRVLWSKAYPAVQDDLIRFDMALSFVPAPPESLSIRKGERNSRVVLKTRIGRGLVGVDVPVLVSDIAFEAEAKIELVTMNGMPFVKTFSLQFPNSPQMNFILKPLKGMDLMDMPGLSSFLHNLVRDIVAMLFVAPNAFVIDVNAMLNGDGWAGNETACGVLMITVIEARDLKNAELTGVSDPYCEVSVRGRPVGHTRVLDSNLNPYWSETFYVLVNSMDDLIEWNVMDKDIGKDKHMGSFRGTVSELGLNGPASETGRIEDVWHPISRSGKDEKWKKNSSDPKLTGKSKGELHLDLHYFPVLPPLITELVEAAGANVAKPAAPDANVFWGGVLRISIHQAKELDETKSAVGQLNPYISVSQSGQVMHKTKVKKRTNNPQWGDLVELFIRNPTKEKIVFTLRDKRDLAGDLALGDCEFNVSDILSMLNLKLDPHSKNAVPAQPPKIVEWWNLRGAKCGKLRITFTYTPVSLDHLPPSLDKSGVSFTPAIGVLRLKVVEARGLINQEVTGMSDPYVNVMYAGALRARTHTIDSSLSPVWHEVFYIMIRDSSLRGLLNFELFDFNNLKNDKSMGKAHYDLKALKEVESSGVTGAWLPVTQGSKSAGEIRVEFSYNPVIDTASTQAEISTQATISPPGANLVIAPVIAKPEQSNTGILRIKVKKLHIDSKAVAVDGHELSLSPYLEFLDSRGTMTSNELAQLAETNSLKSKIDSNPDLSNIGNSKFKISKSSQALAAAIEDSEAKSGDGVSARPGREIVLLYRTKHVMDDVQEEDLEFFVKDLNMARLVVVCKNHNTNNTRRIDKDIKGLVTAEKAVKDSIFGKTELTIKSVLTKRVDESSSLANIVVDMKNSKAAEPVKVLPTSNCYKIFGLDLNRPTIIGNVELTCDYSPVSIDDNLLIHEQDVEATNSGSIKISIDRAENLPAVDSGGTSDPYLKIRLNNAEVFKTKTVKKNCLKPVWNESCATDVDFRSRSRLHFVIRDWNKFEENKILGIASVDCIDLAVDEPTAMTIPLFDENGTSVFGSNGLAANLFVTITFVPDLESAARRHALKNNRALHVVGDAFGAVGHVGVAAKRFLMHGRKHKEAQKDLTQIFATPGVAISAVEKNIVTVPNVDTVSPKSPDHSENLVGALTIYIMEAKNLKAADSNGFSDPYVTVRHSSLTGQSTDSVNKIKKSEVKLFKTKHIKKTLSPVWNESFTVPYAVTPEDGPLKLNFSVKDHNLIGSTDIGEYDLDVWSKIKVPRTWDEVNDCMTVDFWTEAGQLRGGGDLGVLHLKFVFQKSMDQIKLTQKSRSTASLLSHDRE